MMNPLKLFSTLHIIIIFILLILWIFIPIIGQKLNENKKQSISITFVVLIAFQEFYLFIYRLTHNIFDPTVHIPIHLCSFAELAVAIALITKNQKAFELAFYWSFAGTIQAIITPNLSGYTLFDTQFIIFFFSHGLIILCVLWLLIVNQMKIRSSSLPNSLITTNIILIPIGLINWATQSNYMYLCTKPPVNSPLLLGDWPLYIIGFEIIGILFFSMLFIIMKLLGKVKNNDPLT